MDFFYSLSNQVRSLTTEAFQTSAHAFRTYIFDFSKRHVSSRPAKCGVRYPSTFAARGCNPDSGLSSIMDNCQRPLRFKISHVSIRNQLSSERIDYLNYFFLKDKFWPQPQKVYQSTKKQADNQFEYSLQQVSGYGKTISGKKNDEYKRNTSPSKVASWAESHIHAAIISEEGR